MSTSFASYLQQQSSSSSPSAMDSSLPPSSSSSPSSLHPVYAHGSYALPHPTPSSAHMPSSAHRTATMNHAVAPHRYATPSSSSALQHVIAPSSGTGKRRMSVDAQHLSSLSIDPNHHHTSVQPSHAHSSSAFAAYPSASSSPSSSLLTRPASLEQSNSDGSGYAYHMVGSTPAAGYYPSHMSTNPNSTDSSPLSSSHQYPSHINVMQQQHQYHHQPVAGNYSHRAHTPSSISIGQSTLDQIQLQLDELHAEQWKHQRLQAMQIHNQQQLDQQQRNQPSHQQRVVAALAIDLRAAPVPAAVLRVDPALPSAADLLPGSPLVSHRILNSSRSTSPTLQRVKHAEGGNVGSRVIPAIVMMQSQQPLIISTTKQAVRHLVAPSSAPAYDTSPRGQSVGECSVDEDDSNDDDVEILSPTHSQSSSATATALAFAQGMMMNDQHAHAHALQIAPHQRSQSHHQQVQQVQSSSSRRASQSSIPMVNLHGDAYQKLAPAHAGYMMYDPSHINPYQTSSIPVTPMYQQLPTMHTSSSHPSLVSASALGLSLNHARASSHNAAVYAAQQQPIKRQSKPRLRIGEKAKIAASNVKALAGLQPAGGVVGKQHGTAGGGARTNLQQQVYDPSWTQDDSPMSGVNSKHAAIRRISSSSTFPLGGSNPGTTTSTAQSTPPLAAVAPPTSLHMKSSSSTSSASLSHPSTPISGTSVPIPSTAQQQRLMQIMMLQQEYAEGEAVELAAASTPISSVAAQSNPSSSPQSSSQHSAASASAAGQNSNASTSMLTSSPPNSTPSSVQYQSSPASTSMSMMMHYSTAAAGAGEDAHMSDPCALVLTQPPATPMSQDRDRAFSFAAPSSSNLYPPSEVSLLQSAIAHSSQEHARLVYRLSVASAQAAMEREVQVMAQSHAAIARKHSEEMESKQKQIGQMQSLQAEMVQQMQEQQQQRVGMHADVHSQAILVTPSRTFVPSSHSYTTPVQHHHPISSLSCSSSSSAKHDAGNMPRSLPLKRTYSALDTSSLPAASGSASVQNTPFASRGNSSPRFANQSPSLNAIPLASSIVLAAPSSSSLPTPPPSTSSSFQTPSTIHRALIVDAIPVAASVPAAALAALVSAPLTSTSLASKPSRTATVTPRATVARKPRSGTTTRKKGGAAGAAGGAKQLSMDEQMAAIAQFTTMLHHQQYQNQLNQMTQQQSQVHQYQQQLLAMQAAKGDHSAAGVRYHPQSMVELQHQYETWQSQQSAINITPSRQTSPTKADATMSSSSLTSSLTLSSTSTSTLPSSLSSSSSSSLSPSLHMRAPSPSLTTSSPMIISDDVPSTVPALIAPIATRPVSSSIIVVATPSITPTKLSPSLRSSLLAGSSQSTPIVLSPTPIQRVSPMPLQAIRRPILNELLLPQVTIPAAVSLPLSMPLPLPMSISSSPLPMSISSSSSPSPMIVQSMPIIAANSTSPFSNRNSSFNSPTNVATPMVQQHDSTMMVTTMMNQSTSSSSLSLAIPPPSHPSPASSQRHIHHLHASPSSHSIADYHRHRRFGSDQSQSALLLTHTSPSPLMSHYNGDPTSSYFATNDRSPILAPLSSSSSVSVSGGEPASIAGSVSMSVRPRFNSFDQPQRPTSGSSFISDASPMSSFSPMHDQRMDHNHSNNSSNASVGNIFSPTITGIVPSHHNSHHLTPLPFPSSSSSAYPHSTMSSSSSSSYLPSLPFVFDIDNMPMSSLDIDRSPCFSPPRYIIER